MHHEHEEAMRAEFSDCIALSWQTLRADPAVHVDGIQARVNEYDQRWQSGPHAREWNFLCAAYTDWRDYPEDTAKLVADIDAHRDVYHGAGFTDTQRRSLDQARNIANEERSAIRAYSPPQQLPVQRER
ncbi:hypothetical protein [Nocardia sp. CC227C]|uniref:hypothetical protein n=1 Tax=Nocardia sp. CC227C TaxID=3044562 RepID=UPI00278C5FEB|nr:hypothetical protein [Nocardia sp. CC227C]